MSNHESNVFKEAEVSFVVTRADGTVEDLGVVGYYHKNPIKRVLWSVKQRLKDN